MVQLLWCSPQLRGLTILQIFKNYKMTKRIAINGFGRIGRLALRNLLQNGSAEVVAINDLTDNVTLAHLFKYDTAHGEYPEDVKADDHSIQIGSHRIKSLNERDPSGTRAVGGGEASP